MKKQLAVTMAFLVFVISLGYVTAYAAPETITFKVNIGGESKTVAVYSLEDLQKMPQIRQTYSSVDETPAPVIILAEGIDFNNWMAQASIRQDMVKSVKFTSSDGWSKAFQNSFLFQTTRYAYPEIVSKWTENGFSEEA
ncbi:MAG: hypothetical protein RR361_07765, partial [Anaerovorax sp.]